MWIAFFTKRRCANNELRSFANKPRNLDLRLLRKKPHKSYLEGFGNTSLATSTAPLSRRRCNVSAFDIPIRIVPALVHSVEWQPQNSAKSEPDVIATNLAFTTPNLNDHQN